MRGTLAIVTFGVVLAAPNLAKAQGNCPDGWFCEQEEPSGDTADAPDSAPSDSETGDETREAPAKPEAKRRGHKPGTVEYHPANGGEGRQIIIVDRPENAPTPPKRRSYHEWGLNLRLEGILMGDNKNRPKNSGDAGMGGLGFSLRYRPIPYFAFDAGLDFAGGHDWAGNERHETALLLSGIVYFNPYSKVQVYTIGGVGFSGARVTLAGTDQEEKYSYFGAHLGAGLEFRVGRKVALNLDLIGFIRGRTDKLSDTQPEFTDPDTGRVTNTSGGGLARAGITFYW